MTTHGKPATVTRALFLAPLLLVAACASDGSPGSVDEMRSSSQRATNQVPDGVVEMRETMADQRAETNTRLDNVMGASAAEGSDGSFWYTPLFDVLDVAASLGGWLY